MQADSTNIAGKVVVITGASSVGSSKLRFAMPRYDVMPPMGDHACVAMPWRACTRCS